VAETHTFLIWRSGVSGIQTPTSHIFVPTNWVKFMGTVICNLSEKKIEW